jgi:hypothetical protein
MQGSGITIMEAVYCNIAIRALHNERHAVDAELETELTYLAF